MSQGQVADMPWEALQPAHQAKPMAVVLLVIGILWQAAHAFTAHDTMACSAQHPRLACLAFTRTIGAHPAPSVLTLHCRILMPGTRDKIVHALLQSAARP